MSEYLSINIKDAMSKIGHNMFLLPAIQRKFVWDMSQIENLFDSILRGYPINSFMFWKVTSSTIKQNFKFYGFLQKYVENFGENNPEAPTSILESDFYAVIDGQQRLTSLYIGLIGSYKVKMSNKWWQDTENNTPMIERKLYLETTSLAASNIDSQKIYNFRFLSPEELSEEKLNNPNKFWFKVGDVIKFNDLADINNFLKENKLDENKFAMETLTTLYESFNKNKIINYYEVEEQDQDKVLDIFIRTNSGGTPLSFSDLLMSIASANWKQYDARKEMEDVIKDINAFGNPNFRITQDLILKTLLVLSDIDVKFKIKNFGRDNIALFEQNWENIKKSIKATFQLLEQLNFNNSSLRAPNASIPIAYYIYKNNLCDKITKTTYDKKDKRNISKWLSMSLLRGIFGGSSDGILTSLRKIIKENLKSKFPISKIINAFKTNPDKNYNFDDEILKSFLYEQYGSPLSNVVLNLLYPDIVLAYGKSVAQDHMHPKSFFTDEKELNKLKLSDDEKAFYLDKRNYNSCLNLQLLETLKNNSKGDVPLKIWAKNEHKHNSDLYIDNAVKLDVSDFKNFIESRKSNMLNKLKEILEN